MKIGDTVYVLSNGKYHSCIGKVENIYENINVAVRLDGLSNRNSAYGRFYFKPCELCVIEDYRHSLLQKMERRAAELERYEAIAKYDREMAGLLDKYKEAT